MKGQVKAWSRSGLLRHFRSSRAELLGRQDTECELTAADAITDSGVALIMNGLLAPDRQGRWT